MNEISLWELLKVWVAENGWNDHWIIVPTSGPSKATMFSPCASMPHIYDDYVEIHHFDIDGNGTHSVKIKLAYLTALDDIKREMRLAHNSSNQCGQTL